MLLIFSQKIFKFFNIIQKERKKTKPSNKNYNQNI